MSVDEDEAEAALVKAIFLYFSVRVPKAASRSEVMGEDDFGMGATDAVDMLRAALDDVVGKRGGGEGKKAARGFMQACKRNEGTGQGSETL